MSKRILVILMTLSILLSLLAVSVSAESDWTINMLDYMEISDLGNSFSFTSEYDVYLTLPFRRTVTYVDIVFNSTKPLDQGVYWGRYPGTSERLTVESLGNDVYRAYGEVRYYYSYEFWLWVGSSYSSTVYVDIWSINVGRQQYSHFPTVGTASMSSPSTANVPMTDPNLPASFPISGPYTGTNGVPVYSTFISRVDISDWNKFDSLDIFLAIDSTTIDSISAVIGSNVVPLEISYLNGTSPGLDGDLTYTYLEDFNAMYSAVAPMTTYRYIRLNVDVSSVQRTLDANLVINITGIFSEALRGSFSLNAVTGYVSFSETSPIEYWLRNCANSLDELVQSIVVGDEEFAAQVQEANQSVSDFQEYEESLQSDASMNIGDVVAPIGNISSYGNSLQFISGILHRTFTQLGDYQIVILLPIGIGIVCFIASRVRPSDKPGARSDPDQGGKRWQDKSSKSNKQG